MPAKGIGQVKSKLAKVFEKIAGPMTEQTITEILIIGGGAADALTPMATGTLANSRYRRIEKTAAGWTGRYGYTAAYALPVHQAPGTLKGQSVPRYPKTLGNVWDNGERPNGAEPEFLTKGFERDGLADIKAAILRNMKI
jgi:hypothetical protein